MRLILQRFLCPKPSALEGIVLRNVGSRLAKKSESGSICEQVLNVVIELEFCDLLLAPRRFLRSDHIKQRRSSSPHMKHARYGVSEFSVGNGAAVKRRCCPIRMSECARIGGHSCANRVVISGFLKVDQSPTRDRQALNDSSQEVVGGPMIGHTLSLLCLPPLKVQEFHLISMRLGNHRCRVFPLFAELGLRESVLSSRNPYGHHHRSEAAQARHPLTQTTDRPLRPSRSVNNSSGSDHSHSYEAGHPGINRSQIRPRQSQPSIGTARRA